MSSWKKAAKLNQKVHRERHQPEARKDLGLLEKHSDYKKRATDYQKKKRTLQHLRKKALNRNPDEFYHHMINSKVEDGIHRETNADDDEDTTDQIKLMQSQDLKYINMKLTAETRKIQKLQSELHMLGIETDLKNKHTFFVDDDEDITKFSNSSTSKHHIIDNDTLQKSRFKAYSELQKRIIRERELMIVKQKLEAKKHLKNNKGKNPKKLKSGTKHAAPVYQWSYERNR